MTLLAMVCIIAVVHAVLWLSTSGNMLNAWIMSARFGSQAWLNRHVTDNPGQLQALPITSEDYVPHVGAMVRFMAWGKFVLLLGGAGALSVPFPSMIWLWALLSGLAIAATPLFEHWVMVQSLFDESSAPARPETTMQHRIRIGSCLLTAPLLWMTLWFAYTDPQHWRTLVATWPIVMHTSSLRDAVADCPPWLWAAACAVIALCGLWIAYCIGRLGGRLATRFSSPQFERYATSETILYLRSFTDEHIGIHTDFPDFESNTCLRTLLWPRVSFEELLSMCSWAVQGNMITVGRPGEWLPKAGAMRGYYDNDQWQQAIHTTALRAKAIILTLGATQSLGWEIRHIKEWGLLTKCTFVIPPLGSHQVRHRVRLALDALGVDHTEYDKIAAYPWQLPVAFTIIEDGTVVWFMSRGRNWLAYLGTVIMANVYENIAAQQRDDDQSDTTIAASGNAGQSDASVTSASEQATVQTSEQTAAQESQDIPQTDNKPTATEPTANRPPQAVRRAIAMARDGESLMKLHYYGEAANHFRQCVSQLESDPQTSDGNPDPQALAYVLWKQVDCDDRSPKSDRMDRHALDAIMNRLIATLDGLDYVWSGPFTMLRAPILQSTVYRLQYELMDELYDADDPQRLRRQYEIAKHGLDRAQAFGRSSLLIINAYSTLALTCMKIGKFEEMRDTARQMLHTASNAGNVPREAFAHLLLGTALARIDPSDRSQGDWRQEFREGIRRYLDCDDQAKAIRAASSFLTDALELHDYETGLEAARTGLLITPASDGEHREFFTRQEHDILAQHTFAHDPRTIVPLITLPNRRYDPPAATQESHH